MRPQEGPQTQFLATAADIAIYGGAAGGGKTWALLLEPLRHIDNSRFGAVIFRRTYTQVTQQGGMWDESGCIYPLLGASSNQTALEWRFPTGARVRFAHLQHERDKYNYQGAQIALLCFDQLEHFSGTQFFYMLSRNRSTCGVRPYVRATCNPMPDIWLTDFISWWIGEDGYPIKERGGVLRWFVRVGDQIVWADSRDELEAQYPERYPLSVTFIPASIYDNKVLMDKDPGYVGRLMALAHVDQERLLIGNWFIVEDGNIFLSEWFKRYDPVHPPKYGYTVQSWDTAWKDTKSAAYSALTTWGHSRHGALLLNAWREKLTWPELYLSIGLQYLIPDSKPRAVLIEEKASGNSAVQQWQLGKNREDFIRECREYLDRPSAKDVITTLIQVWMTQLSGVPEIIHIPVVPINPAGDKISRAKDASVWYQAGQVWHPSSAPWLNAYELELRKAGETAVYMDWVDSTSQAVLWMLGPVGAGTMDVQDL